MKYHVFTLRLLLLAATPLLTDCSTPATNTAAKPVAEAAVKGKAADKPAKGDDGEVDEYATASDISDPLEKLNRGTFWVNDQLYTFLFRPISKGYELILPRPV
ncbi:MAG: MlaA family lipoprotein, partial [Verrucomicrobia bacterium]|nr:MlaA family lipoprotein [Verrucomicrobiota bacterium]